MDKNLNDFLDQISNVDFQRFDSAKKHIQNGDAFESCVREDINNGLAYNAKNFLLLNFHNPNDGKDYFVVSHDGVPFDDAMDIARAGRFNMGKDLGAQNSGIPATGILLNSNTKNTKYGIFSKTKKDGDVGIFCKYIADTRFKQFNDTDNFKYILKTIYGDEYENYNVFYIRSYNSNIVNKFSSNKRSPLICDDGNCHSLSLICDFHDANVYYVEEYIDTIRPFNTYNKTKCENDLNHFVMKSFKFETKNVYYVDNIYDEKYKFDADIEILVLPNIRPIEGSGSELLTNKYSINPRRKVFEKTFKKFDTYTYQDFKHSVDITGRLTNEPIMFSKYSSIYLELLGVESIGHKFNGKEIVENEDLQTVLNDYWVKEHKLDYNKYICKPSTIFKINIKNVKDFNLIGSIDNTFSTNDSRRLHEIQKKIFEKIAIENSDLLKSFKKYMSKLVPKANSNRFLPCNLNMVTSNHVQVELVMTEKAMELKKLHEGEKFSWKCLPNKVGKKVKTLPIATTIPIPLRIRLLESNEYVESDNVKSVFEGITFQYIGRGVYNVSVSEPYHYNGDENKKIYHNINDHLFSNKYYPKKTKNNINIDGEFYTANIKTDIPVTVNRPPIIDKETGGTNDIDLNKSGYNKNDAYRYYDNPEIICKFNNNTNVLYLNTNNVFIKKLSYNKPDKMQKLWKRVYQSFYDKIVKQLYFTYENPVDMFDLKGNQHKLAEFGILDEKEVLLNFAIKQFILNDSDCQKLMASESDEKLSKNEILNLLAEATEN